MLYDVLLFLGLLLFGGIASSEDAARQLYVSVIQVSAAMPADNQRMNP